MEDVLCWSVNVPYNSAYYTLTTCSGMYYASGFIEPKPGTGLKGRSTRPTKKLCISTTKYVDKELEKNVREDTNARAYGR